jgi:hypothetical protein
MLHLLLLLMMTTKGANAATALTHKIWSNRFSFQTALEKTYYKYLDEDLVAYLIL